MPPHVSPTVVSPTANDSGTPPNIPSISVAAPPTASQSGTNTPLMATPSKAFTASIGSPLYGGDGRESESEVNSIAVEPPSPNRDEISFAVDEQSFRADETAPLSGPGTPTLSHATEEMGVVLSETKTIGKDESMEEEKKEKEPLIEEDTEKEGGGDEIKEEEKEKEILPEEENNGGTEAVQEEKDINTESKEDAIITGDIEDTFNTGETIATGDPEDTVDNNRGGGIEESMNPGDIEETLDTGATITTGDLEESNEGGSVSGKEGEKEEEGGGGVGMVSLVGENNHEASEQVDLVVSTDLNDEELSDFPSIQKEPQDAGVSLSPAKKREGSVGVASNDSSDVSSRKRQSSVTDDNEADKKIIFDVNI